MMSFLSSGSLPARGGKALAIIGLVALAARMATLGNPVIGYDEQFYLLVGDRMLHGMLPYVDIFDRKPVGIFLIYAAARLLGGEGFLQYKLLAGGFAVATGFVVYLIGRRHAAWPGAVLAGIFYVLWLNFMEGEGGQTPVFYNLFIAGAGGLMIAAVEPGTRLASRGIAAMLLTGLAIQVKYSAVFEGMYFGCSFLLLAWRRGYTLPRLAAFAASMVVSAMLPTATAGLYYLAIGHWQDFLFCNFMSVLGQAKGPWLKQIVGLLKTVGVFLPLLAFGTWAAWRERGDGADEAHAFIWGWLAAAIVGVLIYWRFNSPHYALPVLVPACVLLAPALACRPRAAIAFAALVFVAGQIVLVVNARWKGGNAEARAVAALARPRNGCIFVYNGYPALYMLTGSCLPSRWAFPGHVNAADEDSPRALGADSRAITAAILARRPDAIVDTYPVFEYGNITAHALVGETIRAGYKLAGCVVTKGGRVRLVYRPRDDGGTRLPASDHCPPALEPLLSSARFAVRAE